MADRYSFQSPFSRGAGSNPWFTLGSIPVTTTVFMTGMSILGLLLLVVERGVGTIGNLLPLTEQALTRGQVWRFVTHPFMTGSADFFWGVLGIVFFYMIGTQLETMVGRRGFTSLVLGVILVPAVLGVLIATVTGTNLVSFGMSLTFLGVAAAFAAAMPNARSFFNIPFWVVVACFFLIRLLTVLTVGSLGELVMLFAAGAVGLVMIRSLGFSTVEWIPSVPLPALMSGDQAAPSRPAGGSGRRSIKKSKKKSASAGHLTAVPSSGASEAEIDALLDQVSDQGIDSLTKQQKQTLERHSKEMRKRRDS